MGWTSKRYSEATHANFAKVAHRFVDKELAYEIGSCKILKYHLHTEEEDNHELYLAVKIPNGKITMFVVLVKIEKEEIYWKMMDESVMPFYFNAPKYLLDMLSPTSDEYSLKWREKAKQLNLI